MPNQVTAEREEMGKLEDVVREVEGKVRALTHPDTFLRNHAVVCRKRKLTGWPGGFPALSKTSTMH